MNPQSKPALIKIAGVHAALAVLRHRPADVVKIGYEPRHRAMLRDHLARAARNRVAYNEMSDAELERFGESEHHEGIVVIARTTPMSVEQVLDVRVPEAVVLALDGAMNPHNIGAIARSAGFLGASGLIVRTDRALALTPAALRVAEGAAEVLRIAKTDDLTGAIRLAKRAGYVVLGTESRAQMNALQMRFPAKCFLVLGAERDGISAEVRANLDGTICIPGQSDVDSLNVSVAAGILLAMALRRPEPAGRR